LAEELPELPLPAFYITWAYYNRARSRSTTGENMSVPKSSSYGSVRMEELFTKGSKMQYIYIYIYTHIYIHILTILL
jgi:hypothetical protein